MKAIILAAGLGSRIREFHQLPKGFIQIGQQPIVVESIKLLKHHGIDEILIVTGYNAIYYEQLAEYDKTINTIKNSIYDRSGSLFSLYCARQWIDDDFLLLESDLIYPSLALSALLEDAHHNAVLVSGNTGAHDVVYVEAKNNNLIRLSKNFNNLNKSNVIGEFVGINKLSLSSYLQLMIEIENNPKLLQHGHYEEDGLVLLSKREIVYCVTVNDLQWSEIDDIEHFHRAKKMYPLMRDTTRIK